MTHLQYPNMPPVPDTPNTVAYDMGEIALCMKALHKAYIGAYNDYQGLAGGFSPDFAAIRARLMMANELVAEAKTLMRKATNQLLVDVRLCSHCHETRIERYHNAALCNTCYNYQYKYSELPSDEVLAKRFGWAEQ